MNAVEIESAVSELASKPFEPIEFPFAFLEAFGNKDTTLKRLRKGDSNASDVPGAVLQRNNIHIAVADQDKVDDALGKLRTSPKTAASKAKFILATDGLTLEAEELATGETIACDYKDFASHFGFFLPLAGISTVKEIKDNPVDVRATGRLNKLYVELLKDNPDWSTEARRHDMNHFMARLIFCFFAEDTDIFNSEGLFTSTIEQMSEANGANTHTVIETLFRAMNCRVADRTASNLPLWAGRFPYVNGGLFSGSTEAPRFSKIARTYLLHAGALNWRQINPDIFGSMIQAVADDEERGALGMHYTSVPNILKVLNPLFLDDLRTQLAAAGENPRSLLNLRNRLSRIRVFDPACGSGNFLVIAYKEMRAIEAEINRRRGEAELKSVIPLTNFRGIELRDFPAEIARLALVIAEYQCDVLYRGPLVARADFLPLDAQNWIVCGNALRLDWLSVCPPTGAGIRLIGDDLFSMPLDQAEIDFQNEGGESYVCGNPPYLGKGKLSPNNKSDMNLIFRGRTRNWGYIDLVGAWFLKAADFCRSSNSQAALVATNSIVMGRQAIDLWPVVLSGNIVISFAHTSFAWSNNAARNAAVYVVIVGLANQRNSKSKIYENGIVREVDCISHYLTGGVAPLVCARGSVFSKNLPEMILGNKPNDGKKLRLEFDEKIEILSQYPEAHEFIRPFYGSDEYNSGKMRYCLWIPDSRLDHALTIPPIAKRVSETQEQRLAFADEFNRALAKKPHQMREFNEAERLTVFIPASTSERRPNLPCGILPAGSIVSSQAFAIFDAPLWNIALLTSRLHLVWVATVCGKFKEDYRYSNDLGWNTFPVPPLTEQNKASLTRCAEDILLVREQLFPATIADLYDPDNVPDELRQAHDRNDEVLERIYIGRKFRNDTERLEKLFELYTKMTANNAIVTENPNATSMRSSTK